ncbi:EboA domain-containing protein [Streptomyces marispadix]|uniref:EboA domain-containing protein n=1 Tax=Streptomyces marispadix TaxID=2922868 RepID=A0ABS9T4N7_9ACTN|nr:EboA domain-containing protein [Streptomyces marispadix]MCH6163489.1 EboA domain-containing protein [Streptomyces marispadix]
MERSLPQGGEARTWLDDALAEAARAPRQARWELHFASAGRHCGPAAATDARVLLLHAAGAGAATLGRLYRQGTAAERAAVLSALHLLPTGGTPQAVPLVEDALRANDTTLIAAAVGPYAAEHLDAHAWRHAVLKCLFTGVPLDAVAGLARRARGDAEVARMLGDFAAERAAAGRPVPPDLHRALDLTGQARARGDRPDPPVPPHAPEQADPPEEF